ncbi:hypothetical protein Patl1_06016 [Pistacia atlantica]|uniref:Uncharacterized protein n=1 Tax=Pistacia atlantica TaxID=434234 RepID=A0ACC1BWD9_9ROSI|nr:hypothetical protein Patl1_06016 [Pistacia atlantica]
MALSPPRPLVPKAVIESLPLFRDVSSSERCLPPGSHENTGSLIDIVDPEG